MCSNGLVFDYIEEQKLEGPLAPFAKRILEAVEDKFERELHTEQVNQISKHLLGRRAECFTAVVDGMSNGTGPTREDQRGRQAAHATEARHHLV